LNGTAVADPDIHQASGSAPSLAVFGDRLYVAFVANDSGQNVLVCSSHDGFFWEPLNGTAGADPDIQQASNGSAPSLAAFKTRLYVAFIANDSGQNVLVCSSEDGLVWEPLNGTEGANSDIHQASGSGPALAVLGDRLYVAFIANDSGQNVLVCSTKDGFAWEPLNGESGANPDIHQASNGSAPSLAAFQGRLYVAFIANDSGKNVLVCSSQDGKTWDPLDGAAGANADIHQASGFAPALAVAPFSYWPVSPTGLSSNNNYEFYREDKASITGLSVTITLSEDMVFDAASGHYTGFAFQLNAYSLQNANCAFQQYFINYVDDELTGIINNWDEGLNSIINDQLGLSSMPGGRLRRGTALKITLVTSSDGTVTGAVFEVPDSQGQTVTRSLTINLPAKQMAPIVAFQLNIVGPFNQESSVLTSGAGKIEYSAANGLEASSGELTFPEFRGGTAETANTFYSTLPSTPSPTFTQLFKVGSAPT